MIPFQTSNWDQLPATEHKGESGTAYWKELNYNGVRVRIIEYSPDYKADHWCAKGHIIYCLEGEFTSHLKNGEQHQITQGMSYQVSDNEENPHRSVSEKGCKLFVVDGNFLSV